MRLNSSFLSVKLPCYHPQLSDTYTHNGYRTTPQGLKPSIQFCYRPRGTCVGILCSSVSIYYHSMAQKSRKNFIFSFVKMYKNGGWGFGNFDECHNSNLPALETTLSEPNFSNSPRTKFFKIKSPPTRGTLLVFSNLTTNQ